MGFIAIGQIRFDNGALLHIEASFASHIEKDIWNFNLMGDKGGANWDPPAVFTDRAGTMVNETPGWISPKSDFPTLFSYKLRNFVDACLKNTALENRIVEQRLVASKELDVNSTPTFFVNGEKIKGETSFEEFDKKIKSFLKS